MNDKTCSAFVGGSPGVCRNGFPQNSACSGIGCPTCGSIKATPACLVEDVPEKTFKLWFNDAGRPLFTSAPTTVRQGQTSGTATSQPVETDEDDDTCRFCEGQGEVQGQGGAQDIEPPIKKCSECGGSGKASFWKNGGTATSKTGEVE